VTKVRWGILGCGRIASKAIAPAIRWSVNGELHAVASRSRERASTLAVELGAARAYGDYAAMLADPAVEAVYVGLPNGEHERWVIAAAAAGKHVLCDKSLALSSRAAHAMRAAFRARGLVLVEGFMVRHHPQWTLARRLVDALVGPVRAVRAWFGAPPPREGDHRWSKELGGGALFDVTCYAVNAARFFTREEPSATSARARWAPSGVDLATQALLGFPSGAVAQVGGSLSSPFEQGVVVLGDEVRVVLDRPFVPHWDPVEVVVERRGGREAHPVGGANHFLHQVEHFAKLVRDPAADPWPAEDGVANVDACEAILRALV